MAAAATTMKKVPLWPEDDILYFLSEVAEGLHISKDNLRNPTPNFIRNLFEYFLSDFQVRREFIMQPDFEASSELAHYEIYENSIPVINLFLIMKNYMDICMIFDFSLNDILDPKPKRTRKILSHLLNFWRFAGGKLQTLYHHNKEVDEKIAFMEERRQNINRLTLEIDERGKEVENKRLSKDGFENDVSTAHDELMQKKEKAEELAKLHQDAKLQIAEAKKKVAEDRSNIVDKKRQLEEIKMCIPKPPDELEEECKALEEQLETLKEIKKAECNNLTAMKQHIDKQTSLESNTSSCLEMANEALSHIAEINKKTDTLSEVESERAKTEEEVQRLWNNLDNINKMLQEEMEQSSKTTFQNQRGIGSAKSELESLEESHKCLNDDVSEKEKEVLRLDRLARSAEDSLHCLEKEHKEKAERIISAFRFMIIQRRQLEKTAFEKQKYVLTAIENIKKI